MKLYVKACSGYRGDLKDLDLKKELKQTYKRDTRRQDKFIHLALYGALRLKDKCQIKVDDELYITSGVGNMETLQKSYAYVNEDKEVLRPFDFINMLGNTTSYYVASALGMKGKNIFQISNSCTFINSLISIYASLSVSKKEAILGSVDLATDPQSLIKRVLGVSRDIEVLSAVNYQKLSLSSEDAIASIEFETQTYSVEELPDRVKESHYFATQASYHVNEAIKNKKDLVYIDSVEDRYKIIKVSIL